MDAVDRARAFLSVAQTGGFSSAARQLNVAPSVITKRIGQFEAEIGRQLFSRTTRRVELTPTGKNLLHSASEFLLAYERMMDDVPDDASELSGRLRVKAPSTLANLHMTAIINRFLRVNTKVSLELLLLDRPVNPVTEGFDLVITGLPPSYDQIDEIPLFPIRRMLFASPTYLRERGTPQQAEDLVHHRCLQYSYLSPGETWSLTSVRGQIDVNVHSTFLTNDVQVMHQAIVDGLGIGILPDYVAHGALTDGRLVQVLQAFSLAKFWFRAQIPKTSRNRRVLEALILHIQRELLRSNLAEARVS